MIPRGGGVPLLWHTYLGSKPDVTQFPQMISTTLAARHAAMAAAAGQDGPR